MSGDFIWQSRVTTAMNLIIKKNTSQQPLAISTPSNWRATSAPLLRLVSQFYARSIDRLKSLSTPAHVWRLRAKWKKLPAHVRNEGLNEFVNQSKIFITADTLGFLWRAIEMFSRHNSWTQGRCFIYLDQECVHTLRDMPTSSVPFVKRGFKTWECIDACKKNASMLQEKRHRGISTLALGWFSHSSPV